MSCSGRDASDHWESSNDTDHHESPLASTGPSNPPVQIADSRHVSMDGAEEDVAVGVWVGVAVGVGVGVGVGEGVGAGVVGVGDGDGVGVGIGVVQLGSLQCNSFRSPLVPSL